MSARDPFSGIVGHQAAIQVLRHALARPHHSYLLVGGEGLGAGTIAERFVRGLAEPTHASGVRPPDAPLSSHSDIAILTRQAGSEDAGPKAQISVEAVREFRERVSRKPVMASRMVAFVPEADRLNEAGGNALLKCLEEPPADATFVLVAQDESRLPETIKSRSVMLRLSPVPSHAVDAWLKERGTVGAGARPELAEGSPRPDAERSEAVRFAAGHPGRALRWLVDADMRVREAEAARTVDAILSSTTPGHAVAALDADARRADAAEDTLTAWQELLDRLMRAVRDRFTDAPVAASHLGSALALARRRAGGPVSPRVWLELALVRHS